MTTPIYKSTIGVMIRQAEALAEIIAKGREHGVEPLPVRDPAFTARSVPVRHLIDIGLRHLLSFLRIVLKNLVAGDQLARAADYQMTRQAIRSSISLSLKSNISP